uniref:toprim domain-containing protein n=1 Tax=Pedobacter schmidteae TaxID=2201271 RepID=UPI0013CEF80B|nr:toprim domain-containing protein [Pedobacter schmidteae]
MNHYIDANALREQVSLPELLRRLGYQPVSKSGGELKYHSPLRNGDRTPSFMVRETTNEWYDFGLPGGGDLITFGKLFWPVLSFYQMLNKIREVCDLPEHKLQFAEEKNREPRPRKAEKIQTHELYCTKPLGSNPLLEDYLKSRRIWEAAQGKLSEVYLRCIHGPRIGKKLFGIGWQNEYLGWEIRTALDWKHCLGQKGLTIFKGDPGRLILFEGMMDYLSHLTRNPGEEATVIILNSIAMIGQTIKAAADFKEVTCFFDNDDAGRKATASFITTFPMALDGSSIYQGYEDYNAMLMADPVRKMPWEEEGIFGKVMQSYRR